MAQLQKLEIAWIGKDLRPRLEPRVPLEDPKRGHHAKQLVMGMYGDLQGIAGKSLREIEEVVLQNELFEKINSRGSHENFLPS